MGEELAIKKDGTMDIMGVNINISEILGGKIVNEWLGSLDKEYMDAIIKHLTKEYFFVVSSVDGEVKPIVRSSKTDWDNNRYPIDEVQREFAKKTKELILEKAEEIIQSTAYQESINQIAEELVQYATEGYKEDLKKEIKTRLVDNVIAPSPCYGGENLINIINKAIDCRLNI